jgi:hypothetical protein
MTNPLDAAALCRDHNFDAIAIIAVRGGKPVTISISGIPGRSKPEAIDAAEKLGGILRSAFRPHTSPQA